MPIVKPNTCPICPPARCTCKDKVEELTVKHTELMLQLTEYRDLFNKAHYQLVEGAITYGELNCHVLSIAFIINELNEVSRQLELYTSNVNGR